MKSKEYEQYNNDDYNTIDNPHWCKYEEGYEALGIKKRQRKCILLDEEESDQENSNEEIMENDE